MSGVGGPRVFLTDFGLARDTTTGSRFTRTGTTLGTPAYMSPEQARGELADLTPASDVWALGCVLYEMLSSGRRAFDGDTAAAVIGAVLTQRPAALPGVPVSVADLLAATLCRPPAERLRDAGATRHASTSVLAGRRVPRPRAGAPWAPVLAAAVATTIGLGVWTWIASRPGPQPTAVPPGMPQIDPAEAHVAKAQQLRASDPIAAAAHLANALQVAPHRHELRIDRALLLWAVGRLEDARAAWVRVPPTHASWRRAQLHSVLADLFAQGPTLASFDVRPRLGALSGGTDEPAALARAAVALLDQRYGDMRTELEGRTGWEGLLLRAQLEAQDPAGDKVAATEHYRQALNAGVPMVWVWSNLATVLQVLGDAQGAMDAIEQALIIAPKHPNARALKAELLQAAGDLEAAEAECRALSLDHPGYAIAQEVLANLLVARGDIAGSIDAFTRAVEIHEANGDRHGVGQSLYKRANSHLKAGDWQRAMADYDAALEAGGADAQTLNNRGSLKELTGDLPGALADFDQLLGIAPKDAHAWGNRGNIKQRLGDLPGALSDYAECLRLKPESVDILNNRAAAWQALGQPDRARQDFETAIQYAPERASLHLGLAQSAADTFDYETAVTAIERFLELAPTHPQSDHARRLHHWWKGKRDQAR